VKLAIDLLMEAVEDRYDVAVLVSSDTDLVRFLGNPHVLRPHNSSPQPPKPRLDLRLSFPN
jgi:hypothetical protein